MVDSQLPTLHQLRSACLAARVMHHPQTAIMAARESFRRLPSDGVFGARDFDSAQELLGSVSLISVQDEVLEVSESIAEIAFAPHDAAVQLLFDLILERRPPQWLAIAATGNTLRTAAIPDPDLDAISSVLRDPDLREAILLRAARRHDAAALAALGAVGEQHVLQYARGELIAAGAPDLVDQVVQVSRISDQLGYDVIAPRLDGHPRRLEVKTTRRRRWRGEVFLSRNEYEVGLRDPDWALVVVEIDTDETPTLAGWCRADRLQPMIPEDRHADGRWVSASLQQPSALLTNGLPGL
jgi:hypothetical protein